MTGSRVQWHQDPQLGVACRHGIAGRVAMLPAPLLDRAGALVALGRDAITETGPRLAARALEIPFHRPPDGELMGGRPPSNGSACVAR